MSAKVYQFPRNSSQQMIQCKKIATEIANKYGLKTNDIVSEILEHAYEVLPDNFSYKDFQEEVIAICEDLSLVY